MTVTWFQNPDVFWEYLTYAMIVGEILKAPKEWKMKFDERQRKKKILKNVIVTMKGYGDVKARCVSSVAKKWRKKAMQSSASKKGLNKGETKQEI